MKRITGGRPIFILVGNKCDKTAEREVSKEEGAALAQILGCGFIEASAKTAQNVECLFMNLVRSLRATRGVTELDLPNGPTQRRVKMSKCVIM